VSDLWYFAYGSNMSPATFLERRGMKPVETRCAFIDGYRLCFGIPVGPGERGVANVVAEAAARTHGVAYLITVDDAERLDRSEGVPQLYRREAVELRFAEGPSVDGFTYRSAIGVAGRKPSARYLDILLDGARIYGLPATYIAYLEALELAFDERIDAVRR
jgi:cation transport regulator ChaC